MSLKDPSTLDFESGWITWINADSLLCCFSDDHEPRSDEPVCERQKRAHQQEGRQSFFDGHAEALQESFLHWHTPVDIV